MNTKNKYRIHCKEEKSIPIFSQDWWLDSVCGEKNWGVCLVEKGDQILASMPYHTKKRYGFTLLSHPLLTQNLGPWIRPSVVAYSKMLGDQKDLMEALILQLPEYDYFNQNWHYTHTNWLPFYWKKFTQTTRYTYVIDDLSDLDKVFSEFAYSKKKNIKKSAGLINVVLDISADEFYENHKMTLLKQHSKISYSKELFKEIYDACYQNNAGKTIAAYDKDGNLHAALFIVWDNQSAYDLISTIDPDYRKYGAASLLIREAIKFVAPHASKFDFEGSMIESVERSFRQFGAIQKPYFTVTKINSRWLKWILCLKTAISS